MKKLILSAMLLFSVNSFAQLVAQQIHFDHIDNVNSRNGDRIQIRGVTSLGLVMEIDLNNMKSIGEAGNQLFQDCLNRISGAAIVL